MTTNQAKTTKPLTFMQEAFAQAYVGQALGNQTLSAKLAKYKGNDHTLSSVGNENLRKPVIKARIDALQAKTRDKTEDERQKGLDKLHKIRDNPLASDRDQIAAMALEGKMCGWHSETRILETRERQIQLNEAQKAVAARTSLLLLDTKRLPDGSYGTEPPETCNIHESTPGE